ncbi:hypothetical protein ND748_14925 [Frankia sp. AiPs1]|uniref:hypothetical protein n=1 Tax=Frankia sp. AiPs1 TaxID=573493 RepID=UPI002042F9B0|nr:hypothetical protein [Frankia sp. AiPs1]MCM3922948.1 hypothetical protein [Frankia sp. AiPs1]
MGNRSGIAVSWSRHGGADCIRLAGLAEVTGPAGLAGPSGAGSDAQVRIHPATAVALGTAPPTAGRLLRDGPDLCFLPRFPFLDGTVYVVTVDGAAVAELTRAGSDEPATTGVLAIHPSAATVPRNLLRAYIWFSAPMSEGYAAGHVRLVDDASDTDASDTDHGDVLAGALLATEQELWDTGRRRLTVLLDPARIKRGLASHREAGYPLRSGTPFRLVVDDGLRDARGQRLRAGADRRYQVAGDERRHVDPHAWTLRVPPAGSTEPLRVGFDRPLDHGLIARCLRVVGPEGRPVDGVADVGAEERSWQLAPRHGWAPGPHRLVVDPVLEDLAGNSVGRVFDRDLARPTDDPRDAGPVTLPFRPT